MDVNAETARKLREMGAAELLAALSAQDEAVCAGMAFAERVQMAVDEAHSDFITQKVRNLTRRAGLRYPEADVRSVDFFEGRGLDRVAVAELATCGFVGRGENVVLLGLTGTGKTYLACALAKAACARRVRSCYVRQPDLEDLWRESRDRPGGERKLVRKYGAFGLLVIDEWLLEAGHRVQVDAAGADGAEVRHGLDRILHPVQEEGLAPEARRRGACRRHHGQDRAQRGLGRHGRGQHAAAPRIDR